MTRLRLEPLALFGCLWSGLLLAEVAELETEPLPDTMVVTGTRLTTPVEALPGFVTVIDKARIQARQPESTLDLLRAVPGLHVSQPGGRGSVSSLFIRGAEANFTVVLIDGLRVNDPNNSRGGSFDFSTLNVAEVERVEILRGAQSAVYGSDGLAGVINIVTNTGNTTNPAATVEAELGSDGFRRASATAAGPVGSSSSLSATMTTVTEGDLVPGNAFRNHTFTGHFKSDRTTRLALDLSGRFADTSSEAYPEDSGGPIHAVLDDVDERDQDRFGIGAALRYDLSDRTTWVLTGNHGEQSEQFESPGVAPGVRVGVPPNSTDSTLKRTELGTHLVFEPTDSLGLSLGLDRSRDRGESEGTVTLAPGFDLPTSFALERDVLGLFCEMRYRSASGFAASAALRHDDPDVEKAETTLRLGAQYAFGRSRVFANWSEGFKLPSFFALGHALVGNPDLAPETSTTWELGLDQTLLDDRLSITVTLFDIHFQNLIDFDFDLFTNVNRDEVDSRGVDVQGLYRPTPDISLAGHLSHTDIDVRNSDAGLRQRPAWRGGLNLDWRLSPAWQLRLDWLYVGETFDSSIPTGEETLDRYHRLDGMLSWLPAPRWRVWLAVDNLLDADYTEAIGFPNPGVRGRAGVRFSL